MPELIIRSGKLSGRKLVLSDTEVVIGRDDDCQIRLTSADVSRRHCRILPTTKGLVVRDLGSRNGTFVNEEPVVDAVVLSAGDQLRVGPMIFEVPDAEETTTNPPVTTPKEKTKKPTKTKKLHIALPSREEIGTADSSEDDIASWLSAGEEDEEVSTGDTTIIPRTISDQLEQEIKEKNDDNEKQDAEASSDPSSKEPASSRHDSLADEAADIIRKHQQSTGN